MASGAMRRDLDLIAGAATVAGLDDPALLARFAGGVGGAAEAAFEAIVARHGPMVRAACLGVLRDPGEADDAFQATFLVLVRKADSVRVADSLGPWLYGVARRVAVKARAVARKRRDREASAPGKADPAESGSAAEAIDVRPVLYEELDRLPESYRSPVVLCHLEGLSHEEAARRLGWPVGTLSGRLSRARGLLRTRLARRGIGAASAVVVAALAPGEARAVSAALARFTSLLAVRFAAGETIPDPILGLCKGALTAMTIAKLKLAATALAAITIAALGTGYAAVWGPGPAPRPIPIPDPAQTPPPVASSTPVGGIAPPGRSGLVDMMKNGPIDVLRTSRYVAVPTPDGRSIRALSLDSAQIAADWLTYEVPEGTKLQPVGTDDVLALQVEGPAIRELPVFLPRNGNSGGFWSNQKVGPIDGKVTPVVGPGWVLFEAGDAIHALSVPKAAWGRLKLPGLAGRRASIRIAGSPNAIMVQDGETLHVFSILAGNWSPGVPIKPAPPATRPGAVALPDVGPFRDPTIPR